MGARALKEVFDRVLVQEIAVELRHAHSPFDAAAFVERSMNGLDQLELTARAAHIPMPCMRFCLSHLPARRQ